MGATPSAASPVPPRGDLIQTGVEVTAKIAFMQWILLFVKPTIDLDGITSQQKWGTYFFELAPGRHRLEVSFPYLTSRRAGANSVEFDLAAGQIRRFLYRSPWLVFLKGPLKEL